jgi:hypothetical protein
VAIEPTPHRAGEDERVPGPQAVARTAPAAQVVNPATAACQSTLRGAPLDRRTESVLALAGYQRIYASSSSTPPIVHHA